MGTVFQCRGRTEKSKTKIHQHWDILQLSRRLSMRSPHLRLFLALTSGRCSHCLVPTSAFDRLLRVVASAASQSTAFGHTWKEALTGDSSWEMTRYAVKSLNFPRKNKQHNSKLLWACMKDSVRSSSPFPEEPLQARRVIPFHLVKVYRSTGRPLKS